SDLRRSRDHRAERGPSSRAAGLGPGRPGARPEMAGVAWLVAEILAVVPLVFLSIGLADMTWYLIPFLAGVLFLTAWAVQAALAYQAALREGAGRDLGGSRAAAASMAWLTVPLLLWGTGFWLVSGTASSPAAALDRF